MRSDRDDRAAIADGVRDALVAEWGDVSERERTVAVPDYDPPDAPGELFPWAAVALVVDPPAERALLIDHRDHEYDWEPPGGKGEHGERPRGTARRETREETGLDPEITDLLLIERLAFDYGDQETAPVTQGVFAGRASGTPSVPATEPGISTARWFDRDALPEDAQFQDLICEQLLT